MYKEKKDKNIKQTKDNNLFLSFFVYYRYILYIYDIFLSFFLNK